MAGSLPAAIGRYQIERELGRGMMGVVYAALDPDLNRRVALKTIDVAFTFSPKDRGVFEQRFLAEERIVARLSHPGIVTIHDAGRDPATGTLYIALEYLEGKTLAEIIRKEAPLPWQEALRLVVRLAESLHYAHSQGVTHRDVKPGNVMVLASGEPKLMDFGIAKTETARIKLTATGQFFGTPLYTAPEQALGRPVDGRADLFSLGAIAYALVTGKNAFAADNITKIISRVIREEPSPPSSLVAGLPGDIDYLLARSLAKDLSKRYPDGRTLSEDAQDILAGVAPRHREGWPPPGGDTTLVEAGEGELDLERLLLDSIPKATKSDLDEQLANLVPEPAAGLPKADGPFPRVSWSAPTQRMEDPPRPRGHRAAWLLLAAGALILTVALGLGALAILFVLHRPKDATVASQQPPASATESPSPQGSPSRLAIDFQHTLKSGTLRVYVDRELVLEQGFDSRARRLNLFRFRGGDPTDALELPAGAHEIEVQAAWEGTTKVERLRGDFSPGRTRRLRGRVGGLLKKLSVEWE
jgi:serine/threonine protein kinase